MKEKIALFIKDIVKFTVNLESSWRNSFQFIKRISYIDAGMENENFRGSSPEDKERFHRFTLLGYNVGRIDDQVYHLEQSRGVNSWPNSVQGNPYMRENFEEWEKIQLMNKDELKKYYLTQEYLKKYK